jgi:hypothetical protein
MNMECERSTFLFMMLLLSNHAWTAEPSMPSVNELAGWFDQRVGGFGMLAGNTRRS